jgi:hypothetical protein
MFVGLELMEGSGFRCVAYCSFSLGKILKVHLSQGPA